MNLHKPHGLQHVEKCHRKMHKYEMVGKMTEFENTEPFCHAAWKGVMDLMWQPNRKWRNKSRAQFNRQLTRKMFAVFTRDNILSDVWFIAATHYAVISFLLCVILPNFIHSSSWWLKQQANSQWTVANFYSQILEQVPTDISQ
jgi:hypothetical protein